MEGTKQSPTSARLAQLEEQLRRRNAEIEAKRQRVIAETESNLAPEPVPLPRSPQQHHQHYQRPASAITSSSSSCTIATTTATTTSASHLAPAPRPHSAAPQRTRLPATPSDSEDDSGSDGASEPLPDVNSPIRKSFDKNGNIFSPKKADLPDSASGSAEAAEVDTLTALMPPDAALRFHKARVTALQAEVEALSKTLQEKEDLILWLKRSEKGKDDDLLRLHKQLDGLKARAEKAEAKLDAGRGEEEKLKALLAEERKAREKEERERKKAEAEVQAKEVRLGRALEEADKYKGLLREVRAQGKDVSEGEKRRLEKLLAENKRLERQRSELVAAFKKQLRLIDVLKRQKVHMEAARFLAFSEEEFAKTIELGEKI